MKNKKLLLISLIIGLFVNVSLHAQNPLSVSEFNEAGNMSGWASEAGISYKGFTFSNALAAADINTGNVSTSTCTHTRRYKLKNNEILTFPEIAAAGKIHIHAVSGASGGASFTAELILEKNTGTIASPNWISVETCKSTVISGGSTACGLLSFGEGYLSTNPIQYRIVNKSGSSIWLWAIEAEDYTQPDPTAIAPSAMKGNISDWESLAGVTGNNSITTSTIGVAEGFTYFSNRASIECRTATAMCQDGSEHTRRLRLFRNSDQGCYLEFPKLAQAGIVKVCISNGHSAQASYKLALEKKNASGGWDLVEEFSIVDLPGSGGGNHTSISFGKSTFTGSPGSYAGGISSGPITFRIRNTTSGSGDGSGSIYLLNLSVSPYNDATGIEYGASSGTSTETNDLPDPSYAYATPIDHAGAEKWQSELVKMGADGRLTYNKDQNGYILPDFSHAGYKNGDEPIPTGGNVDKILATLEPSTTKQNDATRIQEAINEAASAGKDANGIRGVILLKKGAYYLSQQAALNLNVEGVILRGEGYTNDPTESTVIYDDFDYGRRADTQPNWGTTLSIGNNTGGSYWTNGRSQQTEVLDDTVHVGTYAVKIQYNASNTWNEGDLIVLDFPVGDKWFETVEWGGNTDSSKKWSTSMMNGISYHRYIKKVEHDGTASTTLTMDAPVFYSLAKADAAGSGLQVWKISQTNTYKNIGIENLRIQVLLPGSYTGADEHHSTNAIRFSYAENCWAKNVATAGFVQAGFVFSNSSRITIKDSYALDPKGDLAITNGGERYYNFNFNDNSQLILLDNCYARGGRHNYVSNGTSRVSGIVVYNCKSEYSRTSSEGHRLWTQGMLFDSYEDFNPAGTFGVLGFYNRNNMGSGHGYAMAHGVMWNANTRTPAEFQANNGYNRTGNKGWFMNEKPPTAENYAIGCFGENGDPVRKYDNTAGRRTLGYTEGSNKPGLEPLSLYAAQLHSRNLPPLVEFIRPTLMEGDMSDWVYDGTGGQLQGFTWSEGEGTLPAGSVGSTLSGNQDGHTQRFKLTKNNTLQFPGLTDAGTVTVHLHSGAVTSTYPDGGSFTLVLEKKEESGDWVTVQTKVFDQPKSNNTLCTEVLFEGGPDTEGINADPVTLRVRNDNASIGSLWLMQVEATDYNFPKAIITQPEGFEICAGKTDTLLVEISGKDATFQWYKDGTAVTDATNAMYILSNATHDQSGVYTVKISYPGAPDLLTSEPVTVTISEFAAPAITDQPKGAILVIGDSYTLEVTATGGTSYKWYKGGKEITGATDATYVITSVELSDAGLYKVEVSGGCGDPVMSNEVEIKVGDGTAIFIEEIVGRVDDWQDATWTGSTTVEQAGLVEGFIWSQLDLDAPHLPNPPIPAGKLTVNTMGVGASDGHPAHQKRVRLSEHESVELPKLYNVGTVTVHMSPGTPGNAQVGPDGESVNGREYTLILEKFDEGTSAWVEVETLNFHMAPANNTLCVDQTFGLTQQISSEPVRLRLRNPMDLYEDNRTTSPANPNSFGIWFLMVEGTSYVKAISTPVITKQPEQPEDKLLNESVTFSIEAEGGMLNYQWYKDGVEIEGATNNTYTIEKTALTDNGTYYCVVTNDAGTATSDEITLTVLSDDVSLDGLTINGNNWSIDNRYVIECGGQNDLIIKIATDAKVFHNGTEVSNKEIAVTISNPSVKEITFEIKSQDGKTTKSYTLTVEKYFEFNDLVITRWNNTLIVNNNSTTNGGYSFTSYKWYKNGSQIGDKQYYSAGSKKSDILDKDAEYYVQITTSTGEELRTCAANVTLKSMEVVAYPNPVKSSEQLYVDVDIDAELMANAVIEVYNMMGLKVASKKVEGKITPITLPDASGTYLIRVKSGDFAKDLKVIVK